MGEAGVRSAAVDRDTWRLATGLKGLLGGWNYESYVAYGRTKETQNTSGQVNVQNFRNAMQGVPDVNDLNHDGSSGDVICADAAARAQGCAPLNLFGYNTMSPAALAYVGVPTGLATSVTQKLVGGSLSGEWFELPAGRIGVAAGVEWRGEASSSVPDALTQAGLNSGGQIAPVVGGFTVREAFVETRVPLLKDRQFARELSFLGALRLGRYSTVGNASSWNAGLEWRPLADLKLRATRALSTRAPNITELYAPASQVFPTGIVDPCVGVTASSSGSYDAACRAAPGVMDNIAANGKFTQTQADIQGLSGFNRGNTQLKAEQGRSSTVGLVLTPRSVPALRNLTLTVDYFDIKIGDAIVATPRQYALQQCYGGGNSGFCQFATRRAAAASPYSAGSLSFLDSAVSNSGGTGTAGIDLTAAWAEQLGPGRLSVRLAYTYLKDFYAIPLAGGARDSSTGEVGFARNQAALNLGYQWGAFGVTTSTRYTGRSALDDQFLAQFKLAPGALGVGAKVVHDVQASYALRKTLALYLGVDNAFNSKPPPIISGLSGDTIGTETNASVYDAIGRRFYLGLRGSL
nr:TonB-dependent receptor [Rugamonas sp. CCM 8940]